MGPQQWLERVGPESSLGLYSSALQNTGELGLSLKQFCYILDVNPISSIPSFV